uniref:Uncharacterized protein n=1 Tax=Sphaerodactylus townsendi TaxID=933632 RepID=A0ACB8G628_9SAUR
MDAESPAGKSRLEKEEGRRESGSARGGGLEDGAPSQPHTEAAMRGNSEYVGCRTIESGLDASNSHVHNGDLKK